MTEVFDLFAIADSKQKVFHFLSIVDCATRFHIAALVPSKRPDDVLAALEQSWTNWAGPPRELVCDQGGEFFAEMATYLEAMDVEQRFIATEAPWQNGICERANAAWKLAAAATIKEPVSYTHLTLPTIYSV